MPRTWGWLAAGAIIGALAGLSLGWTLWRPAGLVVETAAPADTLADGSLVLERRPDPEVRPRAPLPRGATLERVVRLEVVPDSGVVVPPNPENVSRGTVPAADSTRCACAPVALELSLIRLEDGSRRVVATATGGTIVGAVDIPTGPVIQPPRRLAWAVGPMHNPQTKRWGGWVARDFERLAFLPLPVTAGLVVDPRPEGVQMLVIVGLRF